MNTHIQRWGNSLAVRIPKTFAEEVGLQQDDEVDIRVQDGQIILSPHKTPRYRLDELLDKVTPENRPDEWDTGDVVGSEVW